jgi:hypothetical protein
MISALTILVLLVVVGETAGSLPILLLFFKVVQHHVSMVNLQSVSKDFIAIKKEYLVLESFPLTEEWQVSLFTLVKNVHGHGVPFVRKKLEMRWLFVIPCLLVEQYWAPRVYVQMEQIHHVNVKMEQIRPVNVKMEQSHLVNVKKNALMNVLSVIPILVPVYLMFHVIVKMDLAHRAKNVLLSVPNAKYAIAIPNVFLIQKKKAVVLLATRIAKYARTTNVFLIQINVVLLVTIAKNVDGYRIVIGQSAGVRKAIYSKIYAVLLVTVKNMKYA